MAAARLLFSRAGVCLAPPIANLMIPINAVHVDPGPDGLYKAIFWLFQKYLGKTAA